MMLRHRCSQRLKCVECIHTNQHHHHEDTQELKSRRKKNTERLELLTIERYLKKDSDICFLDLSIFCSVRYTFSWAKDKQFQVVEMWPPK